MAHIFILYVCVSVSPNIKNVNLSTIYNFTQIGQVVAALFATELFHVHFRAKSSGIQDRVKFEISTHFSVPKWKK